MCSLASISRKVVVVLRILVLLALTWFSLNSTTLSRMLALAEHSNLSRLTLSISRVRQDTLLRAMCLHIG